VVRQHWTSCKFISRHSNRRKIMSRTN